MKKLIGILSALVLMLATIGVVNATPFTIHKTAVVIGDWKWDGGWQNGNFLTASYNFDAISPLATSAGYTEIEKLGTPWKYSLDMNLGANSAGTTRGIFNAITVNDPDTTPATGGYTQYGFSSINEGEFSTTSVSVIGEGTVFVDISTIFGSAFTQLNQVRVNE